MKRRRNEGSLKRLIRLGLDADERRIVAAMMRQKGDLFGQAADRTIRTIDAVANYPLASTAHWNRVIGIVRKLVKANTSPHGRDPARTVQAGLGKP